MKIINELFLIFFQIGDKTELKNFAYLISFRRIREIFNIFKMNGFDYIHEIIIRLLKQIVTRKVNSLQNCNNSDSEKRLIKVLKHPSLEDMNVNVSNISKSSNNLTIEENDNSSSINDFAVHTLNNEDFTEVNIIFSSALQFIKNKITLFSDMVKFPKQLANIIANINFMLETLIIVVAKMPRKVCIIYNIKLIENFLATLMILNDNNKFIFEMERFFGRNDPNLVNNKVLVLKILQNISKLSQILKEHIPNSIVN